MRCKATLAALNSSAPVDDLPRVAAEVMAELERSQAAFKELHGKAVAFAEASYAARTELGALWEFVQTLAEMGSPEKRAEAASEMLKDTAQLSVTRDR